MTVLAREPTALWDAEPARRRAPLPLWAVSAGFAAAVMLALLAGQGGLLRLGYPAGAVLVAALIYSKNPAAYLGFAWSVWFLTPGLRRIADWQAGGWDPGNPMSLTPFLVSGIALLGVLRRLPELGRRTVAPWVPALLCVLYGYFVGVIQVGILPATHALIAWLTPLGLGLFSAVQWRRYPEIQAELRRVFLWGGALLAGYGILQFVAPPIWDRIWMTGSGMYSLGGGFPYDLRVFSLVNSPLPFATILIAGLFVALSAPRPWRMPLLIVEGAALLLSLVRSVWIAGAVGLLVYLVSVPLRSSRRIVATGLLSLGILTAITLAIPKEIGGPTLETVQNRLLTFTDLRHDVSFQDRTSFLDNIAAVVAENPLGHGLGSTGVSSQLGDTGDGIRDFDNGIFAALYSLGWFGGIVMLLSALWIVLLTLRRREGPRDLTAKAARAVTVTSLLLLAGANVFEGLSAAVFWGFAGLVAASHLWHGATEPGAAR